MSEEQEHKTKGICLQAYSSKYIKVFRAAMLHSYDTLLIYIYIYIYIWHGLDDTTCVRSLGVAI